MANENNKLQPVDDNSQIVLYQLSFIVMDVVNYASNAHVTFWDTWGFF